MTLKSAISFILLLATLGCSPPKDTSVLPDTVSFSEVLTLIFDGVASRLQNTGSFVPVSGKVAVTFDGTEDAGNFRFAYSSFLEPRFCSYGQNCTCTGILTGRFSKTTDPNADAGTAPATEVPYDPSTPTTSPTPATVAPDTSTTVVFLNIAIDFAATNMGSGCPPQTDRVIKVAIHNTKQMVITDLGHELLLSPRIYK
jgi:hypothetical protein